MKPRLLIAVGVGALAALLVLRSNRERSKEIESQNTVASIAQNRAAAKGILLAACTNALPGISRVVEVSIDDSADRVSAWHGNATLDYLNSAGGIERTNLHFVFGTPYGDMMCVIDPAWINQVQAAQFNQQMQAARAGSQ